MSQAITKQSQQTESDLRKLNHSVARQIARISAFAVAIVCLPLNAFGQDKPILPEVEIELENTCENQNSVDDDDYSWFGTIMTFPAEPEMEPFRFSSHSKPLKAQETEAFVEGKVEPAGQLWRKSDQQALYAVARDSVVAVKLSVISSKAHTDGTDFTIEIDNLSSQNQTLPAIGLQLPDSMTLISANRVPGVDHANRTVFFPVNELAPKARDSITYRVRTTVAGSHVQNVKISPTNRPRMQVELKTEFETR